MNNNSPRPENFFIAGGALSPDSPSYIKREADDALYNLALSGEYCNVLTSRLMGKTTLIARTRQRLEKQGVQAVFIDLVAIQSVEITPEQWYYALISIFRRELNLSLDERSWWTSLDRLGPVSRFTEFLQQVVLEQVERPIVVFIDEIDATLRLAFTDDFFVAIRAMYHKRAIDERYKRLTFVLVGATRPTDLIKDPASPPYNIGRSVSLAEFTRKNAESLIAGLASVYSTAQAQGILDRILYWTGGHPYLAQRLCEQAVRLGPSSRPNKQIDALVERLFFQEGKQLDGISSSSIDAYIRSSEYYEQMLTIYQEILSGRQVKDDGQSIPMSELKLSGLVKVDENGCLQVRNRIYRRVFSLEWADSSGMQKSTHSLRGTLGRVFRRKR